MTDTMPTGHGAPRRIVIALLMLAAIGACAGGAGWRETIDSIYSGHLPLPLCILDDDEQVRLKDGSAILTFRDGSLEWKEFVRLSDDLVAVGDLDGDQIAEAAVIVGHNGGGSGTFIFLVALRDGPDGPEYAGSWMLGDRTGVKRLRIRDGRILADLIVHGPSDPSCCPSVRVREEFTLQQAVIGPLSCW